MSLPPRAGWSLRLFLLSLLVFAAACSRSRTYEVQGRVVGFGMDGRTVIVDHQKVEGLMPAMTMPFRADDPGAVAGLEHGQAVAFTLAVTPDSSWIYGIRLLPDDALPPSPDGTNAPQRKAVPTGTPILDAGDAVPPFELVSQTGEPVRLSDYRGQALLVTFIYTRCPLPEYCPLLSRNFQLLQSRLRERFGEKAQLLSVSIDPEYDTPAVLEAYARRYTQDRDTWTFATGTPEQVDHLARRFGVYYEQAGQEINHALATALVDPDGNVVEVWRGTRWNPDEVLAAVTATLEETS